MKQTWVFPILLSTIVCCNQSEQISKNQQVIQTDMVRIDAGTVDSFGVGRIENVATFYIDKHLVTYEQYNLFINAGGYKRKKYWSSKGREFLKKYKYSVPSTYHEEYLNKSQLPVTGVSWYEAQAYAKWRGVRLPTAAEWAFACQGPRKQRYPWGNRFDYDAIGYHVRFAPYPVGSHETNVSPHGVFDMVGVVWQWCEDAYEGNDFRQDAEPTGTLPGPHKILRGGGWISIRKHFESDYLYFDKPFHRLVTYGFRCAMNAE